MQRHETYESAKVTIWVWIILAGLLVLAVVVGVGSMLLMELNQQAPTTTETPAAPVTK